MSDAHNEDPFDPDMLITTEQAGLLFGVGIERIRQLTRGGFIPKAKPGRYRLREVTLGIKKTYEDAVSRQTQSSADSRVRDARAIDLEMRNAKASRELIPAEDALAAMDFLSTQVSAILAGIPTQFTRDLPERQRLEAMINEAKKTIAESLAASGKLVIEGGELPNAIT